MDYNREYLDAVVTAWRANWRGRVAVWLLQIAGALVIAFAVHDHKLWWVLGWVGVSVMASLLLGSVLPPRPRGDHTNYKITG